MSLSTLELEMLDACSAQLQHWKRERGAARAAGDVERISVCERAIQQCEATVSTLHETAGIAQSS
jgi:hypothetical protein